MSECAPEPIGSANRVSNLLARGEELLVQGQWHEVARYAEELVGIQPQVSRWLRVYLAMEQARIDEAVTLLSGAQVDPALGLRWSELQTRIALLHNPIRPEQLQSAIGDENLPFSLRARSALALGDRVKGLAFLEVALGEKPVQAETYWLAGLLAAEKQARNQAQAFWAQALAVRPVFAACLYDRGRYRLGWGDLAGEEDCLRALAIKPWAGTIAITLAKFYEGKKTFIKAVKVLDQTLMAREDQPEVVSALIDILRWQGEHKAALSVSDKAIAKYPENGGIWLAHGALLQQMGQRENAIYAYQRAKQSIPLAAAAANNIATMLLNEGDMDSAIVEWEEALRLDPGNHQIACNLGQALLQRGDFELAHEQFQRVLHRLPSHVDALRGMARCCQADENEKLALEFAERALALGPHDVRNYLTLATILSTSGKVDEGIRTLQSGLTKVEKPVVLHRAIITALVARHDFEPALATAQKALAQFPAEYEYYAMTGEVLLALNRFADCEKVLQQGKLVDLDQGGPALIRFYQSRNRYEEALREAEAVLAAHPEAVKNYGLLGEVLYRMGRYEEARTRLEQGRKVDPSRVSINRQLAGQCMARERYAEALVIAREFMQQAEKAPQFQLLIEVLLRSRDFPEAYRQAERFFAAVPGAVMAALSLSRCAEQIRNYERAVEVLAESLRSNPKNFLLHSAYIGLLCRLEKYDEALRHAYQLLSEKQEHVPQVVELAVKTLVEANELEEALTYLNRYIHQLKSPRRLWIFKYMILRRLERKREAEQHLLTTIKRFSGTEHSYKWVFAELVKIHRHNQAAELVGEWQRRYPVSWEAQLAELHLAEIKNDMGRIQELTEAMLAKWSTSPHIWSRLARAYSENWLLIKAIDYARKAYELRPDNLDYLSGLLLTLTKAGDFLEFDDLIGKMEKLLGDRRYRGYLNWFFVMNSHPEWSAEKIFFYQRSWGQYAVTPYLPPVKSCKNTPEPGRRLRIGYVSPDFRRHAVAYFSEPLLIEHERSEFELYAFVHFEPDQQDAITERYKTYFHHWIDISTLSNEEFLRKVREHQIDILVDLAGHTKGSRLIPMAQRPAPIQVSYALGAGQTTGLEQIDYFIVEKNHVPDWFAPYCTEKVVKQEWPGYPYMPDGGAGEVSEPPFLRNGFITFGSVSRPIRIGSKILRVWAKLLNSLPEARLQLDHLPYAEPEMQELIRTRFLDCGGNPEQLLFANTRPYWDFYKQVDIMLDTFPAGSGTTATDSLWMGVPVVTVASRPLMGLFATIQLKALGLEKECVAADEEGYLTVATRLATDRELLAQIRMGLRERFLRSSLMDYKGYGRDIARIYREMWVTWCREQQGEA